MPRLWHTLTQPGKFATGPFRCAMPLSHSEILDQLTALLTDDVPRVRAAAARAIGAIGGTEQIETIRPLLKDAEIDVRRGAQQAIDQLRGK